jgi:hypothetical protein
MASANVWDPENPGKGGKIPPSFERTFQPTKPMAEQNNTAAETLEGHQGEDRRQGIKDRRIADKDRRNQERLADEIAPRRHPDIKGRRSADR